MYKCEYCNENFLDAIRLKIHKESKHNKEPKEIQKKDIELKEELIEEKIFNASSKDNCSYWKNILKQKRENKKTKIIPTNLIICEYCEVSVNKKNYEKHLKKCPKYGFKNINKLSKLDKTLSVNKFKCRYCSHICFSYEDLNKHERKHGTKDILEKNSIYISCLYCNESGFEDFYFLDKHVHSKHINKWNEYNRNNKLGTYCKNTSIKRCQYCGMYTDKIELHLLECRKNKNLILHSDKKSINTKMICKYCKNNKNYFSESHILEKHIRNKHTNEEYKEYISERIYTSSSIEELIELKSIHKSSFTEEIILISDNQNKLINCDYCQVSLKKENLKKHLKKCKKYLKEKNDPNTTCLSSKADFFTTKNEEINCIYCSINFKNLQSLDFHISTVHVDKWAKYLEDEEVKSRVLKKKEIRCNYCGLFLKNIDDHLLKCSKRNNILFDEKKSEVNCNLDEEKKIVEDSVLFNNTDESKEKNTPKLKEQIPKHKAETYQYDEALDIDIVTDEEKYQKDYTQQVQKDIKEFDESIQNEILQTIVIVRKNSNTKLAQKQRQKIRDYLYQYYKGHCQICAFTFRKEDEKNSFEMFNWNDKRVVKKKKSFISRADSLCLCRNCSANIKWGAFEPIFIDRIDGIRDFAKKSLDEIKEIVCAKLEDNIVNKFKDDYEWNDIYALEITVNDKPKNIYMTNRHLIELIAYLKLEGD